MKAAAFLILLLLAGCAGAGDPCKIEQDGPEIGWVSDVEHDSQGRPLTGLPLFAARLGEALTSPYCQLTGWHK